MYEGRHKDKYRKEKGNVIVFAKQYGDEIVKVTHDEVKQYVEDEVFQYYLAVYNYVKLWGLPNNVGWLNEDALMIQAITAIELEAKDIEYEKIHANNDDGGNGGTSALLLRKGAMYG